MSNGSKEWETSLVGHFLDSKLPFHVVNSTARKIWRNAGLLEVHSKGNGFFLFKFRNEAGLLEVLEGGPWLIAGHHIFLKRWRWGLRLTKEVVSRIPVWVQLHDVPLEYWIAEGLSCLASAVGIPLYADSATEGRRRLNYARVCIEIDASKPIVTEFSVDLFNDAMQVDGTSLISVIY